MSIIVPADASRSLQAALVELDKRIHDLEKRRVEGQAVVTEQPVRRRSVSWNPQFDVVRGGSAHGMGALSDPGYITGRVIYPTSDGDWAPLLDGAIESGDPAAGGRSAAQKVVEVHGSLAVTSAIQGENVRARNAQITNTLSVNELTTSPVKRLSMRPTLIAGRIVAAGGIPTSVVVGAHAGYSMPIWSTPANQYEELYFREYIAGRWDGASDITISLLCALASAETAGEDFAFQLSWENVAPTGVLTTSTTDVTTQQELATGRAAQYSLYKLDFAIDWDGPTPDIDHGDHFACRIRRVAATGAGVDEVDGEIIVVDCIITYSVDKMYKTA